MTKEEHLQWCKDRAFAEMKTDGPMSGYASVTSDLSKHEGTKDHVAIGLGMMLLMTGHLNTPEKMQDWIEGFR